MKNESELISGQVVRGVLYTTIVQWFETPFRWTKHVHIHRRTGTKASDQISKAISEAGSLGLRAGSDPHCKYSG